MMSNVRKRKLSLSKRHVRRIVSDETNIDIAGCSKQENICIEDFSDSKVAKTVNKNIDINNTINFDNVFDVNNTVVNIDNEILSLNNEHANNYEQCETNVTRDNDHNSHSVTIDKTRDIDIEFKGAIAKWAVSYNVPQNACNALLKILQEYTSCNFPSQMRTLLQTPRQTDIMKVCGEEYFHWGFDNIIRKMILKCDNIESIDLLINIDGLPLRKSSRATLWPILCSNMTDNTVYLVGAYFGYEKPRDSNAYLQSLVNDLTRLINEGYRENDKVIKIKLFGLICDAPAKAFALCIKGHTGFYSCTKCTIKGKYINGRICFPTTRFPCCLRTDELFSVNGYKDFQTGFSILNNIPQFLPLSHTPLDYMHLLCLGVIKKIILLWIKGPFSVRLSSRSINKISHLLILIRNSTPNEFVRKPRSLKDVKLWKAVEFRNFLLYTGPVILKNILKKDIYNNFITLHVAITILGSPRLCQDNRFINYAEALLSNFVISFEILYGKQYVSHNVHNLLHLCSDVRIFGSLDNFSAFRFENFMTSIKRLIRKNEKPLQQLIRRYNEIENVFSTTSKISNHELYLCTSLHKNGPLSEDINDIQLQYLQLSNKEFNINCKKDSDNCFILKSGLCILILNIVKNKNGDIYLIGKKLKYVKSLYELPCKSDELSIKIMSISDNIYTCPVTELKCKVWKIPYENDPNMFVIFPLIHLK